MPAQTIRVLLVEDHLQVRQGLRRILESDARIQVVDDVGDGEAALEAASRLHPTVAIIDIGLPGMNGIEVASEMKRQHSDTSVLMLSMHGDEAYVKRSLKAGAKGYVLKDAEEIDLVSAVRSVARGEPYFSPALHPFLLSGFLARQDRPRL